ncbi:hypothetical protein Taro_024952 [Colocasia esculenta]|uniref:Uncharacterized protein n=1 Tax=Colocasia esculenta TaxID=4460 RepID=A0A843V8W4_COLES|nr:hypothetical protein [Colocasia esculenta]
MTLHHDLYAAGYFFNPKFKYKDNVHNDGEVMRDTMNAITRLVRTMDERLDAMAEVERYRMKLGIYGEYDMRCAVQRLTPGPTALSPTTSRRQDPRSFPKRIFHQRAHLCPHQVVLFTDY